jgi:hypothetical protein
MKRRTLTFPALLTLMLAAAVPPVFAQTENDEAEGPGRGVARLSLMNGEVSVRRGDSGDWVAAAINAPLMTEDRVFSGPRSRAEVQFDYYHRIRLAEDTEVRLSDIENGRYLIQLARGTATFSALKGGDAQVEISTPAAAVRPVAYGSYRITVGPDGEAEITVRDGEVEIYTPSGTQRLKSGRTMLVRNGVDGAPVFQMVAAIGKDDWDRFNDARDKELRRGLQTYQYVSRDIYGAEDLYGNGDWVEVAPYGRVWRPYVAIGWAPYRYGRWSWVDYYGWSWVSYDPWGWAPYHYGRWFNHGGRWCWYPGAYRGSRHYWSPGLVAWFGWGNGGVGIGIGGGWGRMGWVPLAPYDPFHRWWGRNSYRGYRDGRGYNNLTVVNNVNITNVYRNARVTNAISVHDGDFSRGMRGQAFRGNSAELGRASLMRGGVPVTPQREGLRFADREARAMPAARSGAAGNEKFYSRTQARSVERVPFDRQREAMQSAERRTGTDARRGGEGIETIRGGNVRGGVENGAGRTGGNSNARTAEEGRGGWRTAGEPATTRTRGGDTNVGEGRTAAPGSGETGGATTRSGWRSFGDPAGGRTSSGEAAGTRTSGEASGARTGRSADAARGGEAANSDSRGAWRGFGDPGRGSRSESTVRTGDATEGSRSGSPARSAEGATSGGRGTWSTRGGESGGDRGAARSVDPGRSSETRSTGGGSSDRGSAPARVESQRSETPRSETRSAEPARSSPPARSESPSRTESPRTESPRTGGRGNDDMAGARTRAPVSTGSGFVSGGSGQRWSTRSSDMGEAGSSRSVGSTGGGSSVMSESRSTGRGNWSTGGGETSSRSMSSSRSETYSGGNSGMSSSRSMPSTRSMESSRSGSGGGGMSAPSMGSRSSGGFGGGGGIRSSGGGGGRSGGGGGRR